MAKVPPDPRDDVGGEKGLSLAPSTESLIVPELIEAIRSEGGHVDVNVLLVQVVNKSADPADMVVHSEKMLTIAEKYEAQRVENFKRMANAIIDVKQRDPDEIEKRRNNRMRRCLKGVIGGYAVVGLLGGAATVAFGGSLGVAVTFLSTSGLALALLGPLATGESVSSNDIVRIVTAMRTFFSGGASKVGATTSAPKKRRSRNP